jgi:hypothetical protein
MEKSILGLLLFLVLKSQLASYSLLIDWHKIFLFLLSAFFSLTADLFFAKSVNAVHISKSYTRLFNNVLVTIAVPALKALAHQT